MPVINTNTKALDAQESMRVSGLAMSQAMERLSTGKKINSAKDDAAGLAISNRMTAQIRGLAKAIQNSNDAISMAQTAEGAYSNVGDMLQRMRELAVQAASGTNSAADRANIQLEVKQLQAQIDDVANRTNHNNIKLLDGTASNVVIQTNINSNDTMSMSFDSVKTKDIGVGSRASLMAVGGTSDTTGAITAGTLLLNGVLVGGTSATDDNASQTAASGSAIAKVAAINRVSAQSGVYAKVEANVVAGSSMTASASTFSDTITINGVVLDSVTTATDNSLTRKLIVNAINAKSAMTGVNATDTGDDTLGITLVAVDGRNITVGTSLTTAVSGLRTGTETGSYSLFTLDNRDITIDTVTGSTGAAAIANSGLSIGTFKSNQTSYTTYTRNGSNGVAGTTQAPATTASPGLLDNASLIINGVAVGAALTTDDTSSYTASAATGSSRAGSAIAIAAAINRVASQTGVTATASANTIRGQSFTAGTAQGTLTLNGSTIYVNTTTRNGVIDSINAYSGLTGVVASTFGEGIQLVAADGRNITFKGDGATTAANFGLDGVAAAGATTLKTFYSTVTLNSSNKFTIQAGKTGVTNLEYLGFRTGTYGGSDNGLKVNQVDVSSISGATQALTAIDAAIETVSRAQAKSGALNNRLDVIINNLTETSSNIQASRSRITDTDYAVETANLAKQQIISQAATAMLAQANQQSQSVLSLLK